jgi:hypothetical protein
VLRPALKPFKPAAPAASEPELAFSSQLSVLSFFMLAQAWTAQPGKGQTES